MNLLQVVKEFLIKKKFIVHYHLDRYSDSSYHLTILKRKHRGKTYVSINKNGALVFFNRIELPRKIIEIDFGNPTLFDECLKFLAMCFQKSKKLNYRR